MSILVDVSGEGLPAVVHWGDDLGAASGLQTPDAPPGSALVLLVEAAD